jgi:hypothetical protein
MINGRSRNDIARKHQPIAKDEISMNKETILSIADQYFRKVNPGGTKWTFRKIFYGPFIPDNKLSTARQAYASFSPREESPILLYDDTVFGTGKTGFLITNEKFYYSMSAGYGGSDTEGSFELSDIHSFHVQVNKMSSDIFVNDKKLGNVTQINRAEALVVEDFFDLIRSDAFQSANEQVAAANDSSVSITNNETDIMGKIKQLKELLDMEAITQEEFVAKKKDLLSRL